MKKIILTKQNSHQSIEAWVADNFIRRFLGLMGWQSLSENEGLLLTPCNSVHMCFMRFPIDVVYLVPELNGYRVEKVVTHLRPWIGFSACWSASCALELASGTATEYDINTGDVLLE